MPNIEHIFQGGCTPKLNVSVPVKYFDVHCVVILMPSDIGGRVCQTPWREAHCRSKKQPISDVNSKSAQVTGGRPELPVPCCLGSCVTAVVLGFLGR